MTNTHQVSDAKSEQINKVSSEPPATARGWFDLGKEKQRSGDLAAALDAYRHSLKMNPVAAAAWIGLAEVLEANQQPSDALECYKRGFSAEPSSAVAATRLARSLQGLGQVTKAREVYDRALQLNPKSINAWQGLGELLEDMGDPEGAARAYRKILDLEPSRAEALANILGLGRSIDISAEIGVAKQKMREAQARDKALIGYGLGKALDRLGEYDDAFAALDAASRAREENAGTFNRDQFDARIERLKHVFSAEFFRDRSDWGTDSGVPVFIVGLPRSGTTLTEQIIGSHPQCYGAGELGLLADLATGTPDVLGRADPPWPACAQDINAAQAREIGENYVSQVTGLAAPTDLRISDKQPLNFWHLGLVAMTMPKAKIIHCTRDIRDNGLSIYSQNFNPSQRWSTDLASIAHYWQGYRQLMAHWQAISGLEILEVAYEDTVADIEQQAKRLLDYLALDWDESVLSFHKSERAVQTPSRWQVRQPIYKTSKAKWLNYEKHLDALIQVAKANGSS